MKRIAILGLFLPMQLFAAAFVYEGDWRSEFSTYHDLDLSHYTHGVANPDYAAAGMSAAHSDSKNYWAQRFKIKPELIIDDNLRMKSELIFLAGSALNSTNMGGVTNGATNNTAAGGITGLDNKNASIAVRRIWMEWVSDWGILAAGRQPFHFGLGMTFNSGDKLWDYYGNTVDRISYELKLGTIDFKIGYDVLAKGALNYSSDDQNGMLVQVTYLKPETDMEMGFLWYTDRASANPLGSFWRTNIQTFDVYSKKKWVPYNLSLNWEAAYRKGQGPDYYNLGTPSTLVEFGLLMELLWNPGSSKLGLKTGLATGDSGGSGNKYMGFQFNPAYKLGLLLFNEDINIGGDSMHASQGIGQDFQHLGAFFFAPSYSYAFLDRKLNVNADWIYAGTQKTATGRGKSLGTELDFSAGYKWKENMETSLITGFFFPSDYFFNRSAAFGLSIRIGVTF
jgi:hypothetical protein